MAIIKDAGSHQTGQTGTTVTFTNALTVASNTNRLLLVAMDGDTASDKVTGVTWDGVAMTKIQTIQKPSNRFTTFWYLLNPNTGTKDLVVTNSSSAYVEPSLVSYYNVKQQAYVDKTTNSGTTVGLGGQVGTNTQADDGQVTFNIAIVSRDDNPKAAGTYRLNFTGDAQYVEITSTVSGSILGILGEGADAWVGVATSWEAVPDEGGFIYMSV